VLTQCIPPKMLVHLMAQGLREYLYRVFVKNIFVEEEVYPINLNLTQKIADPNFCDMFLHTNVLIDHKTCTCAKAFLLLKSIIKIKLLTPHQTYAQQERYTSKFQVRPLFPWNGNFAILLLFKVILFYPASYSCFKNQKMLRIFQHIRRTYVWMLNFSKLYAEWRVTLNFIRHRQKSLLLVKGMFCVDQPKNQQYFQPTVGEMLPTLKISALRFS